jgi:assimilatory nitrate reductase catalytic subunit
VRLVTRRGSAVFRARVTDEITPGTVFVPFHWAGRSGANSLTDARLDPVSGMPEFKACAVRLERVGHGDALDLSADPGLDPDPAPHPTPVPGGHP